MKFDTFLGTLEVIKPFYLSNYKSEAFSLLSFLITGLAQSKIESFIKETWMCLINIQNSLFHLREESGLTFGLRKGIFQPVWLHG